MTGNDRAAALRQAERAIRQGRLDRAIAEYERLVEDQPRDWSAANALGDLYVRAGRLPEAIAAFTRVADAISRDGFGSRAAAFYKKVLKLDPRDEHALLRTADIAAEQGLLADARLHLRLLEQILRDRGDVDRADEVARRTSTLVPPVTRAAVAGAHADAPRPVVIEPIVTAPEPRSEPEPDPVPPVEQATAPAPSVPATPVAVAAIPPDAADEEIDLSGDLDALTVSAPALPAARRALDARSLDEAFAQLREGVEPLDVEHARAVLYDLGEALEAAGDTPGALAVFLELRADAGTYRDVDARVERLTRNGTRG